MNNNILKNIQRDYPTLQFGLNCTNCEVYGTEDSKEFGMCSNCCTSLLNDFAFYKNCKERDDFIKSEDFDQLHAKFYIYLHSDLELAKKLFNHIDKNT
jgi:hypothetical protein